MLAGGFSGPGTPAGGVQPGGAVLAQLGTSNKSPGIQVQEPLDGAGNWALDMVDEAAQLMSGSHFEARHDPAKVGPRRPRLPAARSLSPLSRAESR